MSGQSPLGCSSCKAAVQGDPDRPTTDIAAFCSTEGCAYLLLPDSGRVPLVLHASTCQPRHRRVISAPELHWRVCHFLLSHLSLRHLVGQALSSSLPLPAVLLLRLQCPQQWQEQRLYSECLQSALKTPPKLKPERPELRIHERQVPPRKQQLTSLLLSSQVTSQPKGDLSMVLALLQDCQCQRAETNHCELHSFLK